MKRNEKTRQKRKSRGRIIGPGEERIRTKEGRTRKKREHGKDGPRTERRTNEEQNSEENGRACINIRERGM